MNYHDAWANIEDADRHYSNNPEIPIRIILSGSNKASALGLIARGDAPVLKLCRDLLAAGFHPNTPAQAFRGSVLALRIRTVGQGAQLRIDADRFEGLQETPETSALASSIRKTERSVPEEGAGPKKVSAGGRPQGPLTERS